MVKRRQGGCPNSGYIPREINLAIHHKVAYISDVLTKWKIILFLVSKCTILGSKDTVVEGESLFTELTCVGATRSTVLEYFCQRNKQPQQLQSAKFISLSIQGACFMVVTKPQK